MDLLVLINVVGASLFTTTKIVSKDADTTFRHISSDADVILKLQQEWQICSKEIKIGEEPRKGTEPQFNTNHR